MTYATYATKRLGTGEDDGTTVALALVRLLRAHFLQLPPTPRPTPAGSMLLVVECL